MTIYSKSLSEPWFSLIYFKHKKVEGRLNVGDFKKMKENDIIIWHNKDFDIHREYKTMIKYVKHYDNFTEYLRNEKLERCLPTIGNIEDGLKIYYRYYNKTDEEKYGVVAIRLKIC